MNQLLVSAPNFGSALEKADPDLLWRSVAAVMASYYQNKLQPGAEKWQSDTRHWRPRLVQDVVAEWSHHAGCDIVFPWHDDYVLEVWVKFRKQTPAVKRQHWGWFGIAIPDKFDGVDHQCSEAVQ